MAARGKDSFTAVQLEALSSVARLTVHCVPAQLTHEQLAALARNAEVLGITRRATTNFDEALTAHLPRLRGLAVYSTGYDWIDVDALQRRGITLALLPDYSTLSVAEHTLGMMLTLSRRLHLSDRVARNELPAGVSLRGWELAGKTLGLIGFGRIGQAVARLANAFSMRVLYYDRRAVMSDLGAAAGFDQVLASAEVVVLACSHERGAAPLIDASALAQMKAGSYLVNPARRALVDHEAVLREVVQKRLAGYAVDDRVFSAEQLARMEPGRILQSAHTAWYSNEAMARGTQGWVDNLVALARHRCLRPALAA
jgi:phosphoglycerate dehydrogenase-like enzyme